MAQLGGKSTRTLVTSLEILSDDGTMVLMLDSLDGMGSGGVKIRTRNPWDSSWKSGLPTWSVGTRDAEIVAKIVANSDAQYNRISLDAIPSTDFSGEDVNAAEVEKQVEARCSQLDIERAKAANIAEEKDLLAKTLVVQHMDDKHLKTSIIGCEICEENVRATTLGYPFPGDTDERGSFTDEALDEPFTHGTYDPDDDSTKTPARGYGEV